MAPISFTLNGERITAEGVDPNTTLLAFLRERGMTGTKEGCAEGECGACAVAIVRRHADGTTRYEPINSCLVLLPAVADQDVVTVEGIAQGDELHPVQQAMVELGGSQCGYCTPGFVVSLFAEYYRPGRDGFNAESIGGNLCRCTGYRPIRDAATGLGKPAADDAFAKRLQKDPPPLRSVEYAEGGRRFFRPTTLEQTLGLLAKEPKAQLVAGGTDVVVDVNQKHSRFDCIVSLEAVEELRRFEWRDDALEIGAGVPLSEVEDRLAGKLSMLEQLLPLFSSRLIRNRATLGGNLATASPIGDGAPALLALDAEIVIAGAAERSVPLAEFFTGYRKTALRAGELIARVRIPLPLPAHMRFYKLSKRELDDISTVAGAFALDFDRDKVKRARLGYGGVAATPIRAFAAEKVLEGARWDEATVTRAAEAAQAELTPISDHRGSQAYRHAMVGSLLHKLYADIEAERGKG